MGNATKTIAWNREHWRTGSDSNRRYGRPVHRISSLECCMRESLEPAPNLEPASRIQCGICSDCAKLGKNLPTWSLPSWSALDKIPPSRSAGKPRQFPCAVYACVSPAPKGAPACQQGERSRKRRFAFQRRCFGMAVTQRQSAARAPRYAVMWVQIPPAIPKHSSPSGRAATTAQHRMSSGHPEKRCAVLASPARELSGGITRTALYGDDGLAPRNGARWKSKPDLMGAVVLADRMAESGNITRWACPMSRKKKRPWVAVQDAWRFLRVW
jgi:hypothetical protein